MTNGFGKKNAAEVVVYKEELNKLMKKYKKIKKYMRSSLYQVETMDGTEKTVSQLIKEYEDDPL